jgi:broad specificity phosphatase PhoE
MTRLIVWRHGQTDWNLTGRVQGKMDVDLNAVGEAQTLAAADRLARRKVTRIIASDLRRASRAAEALSGLTSLPVEFDARLRERDYGPWEGLARDEIRARYPVDFARWERNRPVLTPGIESMDELGKRTAAVFSEAATEDPDGTIVLATHGAAARAGCAATLGWPIELWWSMTVLENCHVTELRLSANRGWQLHAHNVG